MGPRVAQGVPDGVIVPITTKPMDRMAIISTLFVEVCEVMTTAQAPRPY
jgi:hypothetical protein